ncbi:hypothetical protein BH11BAC5_BH11BAC5_21610 [soil metagenome]
MPPANQHLFDESLYPPVSDRLCMHWWFFFCNAPPSIHQLKNTILGEPDETISYRVDNYNVTAKVFPDQEPQAFVIKDTLIFGFKCHGKYEAMNKEDTL